MNAGIFNARQSCDAAYISTRSQVPSDLSPYLAYLSFLSLPNPERVVLRPLARSSASMPGYMDGVGWQHGYDVGDGRLGMGADGHRTSRRAPQGVRGQTGSKILG